MLSRSHPIWVLIYFYNIDLFYLATAEIKQIVTALNRPPFMQNLSLVEFDDRPPLELLELLNKVLGNLD